MQIKIIAKKPERHRMLSEYVPFVETVFAEFRTIGIKKPPRELLFKEIISRRLYAGRIPLTMKRGLAGCYGKQWWLAINLGLGHPLLIQECLVHEIAHIADALKTGKWGHGKSWEETHEQLKTIVFGRLLWTR